MRREQSPCLRHGCSRCCRNTEMPISIEDATHISTQLKRPIAEFTKPLTETEGVLELANNPTTMACVFLVTDSADIDAAGICSIHEIRPTGCKIYPAILDQNNKVWMDDICPHSTEFAHPTNEVREQLLVLDSLITAQAKSRN